MTYMASAGIVSCTERIGEDKRLELTVTEVKKNRGTNYAALECIENIFGQANL